MNIANIPGIAVFTRLVQNEAGAIDTRGRNLVQHEAGIILLKGA